MVKAFFSVKQLQELYKALYQTYSGLKAHKGEAGLNFKDKLAFEMFAFSLPLLEDYFDNNLYSLQNYARIKTIIEASSLLSVSNEESFAHVNVPLLEPQQAILDYRVYIGSKAPFIDNGQIKFNAEQALKSFSEAIKKDGNYSYGMAPDSVNDVKVPLLLGRNLESNIRTFLGYIYDGIYLRSGEFIHLINYEGLDNKYLLSFFNDVTRMVNKVQEEYAFETLPGESEEAETDKSVQNVYSDEIMALKALLKKIQAHYKKSFLGSALSELIKMEESAKNDLLHKRYYDLNGLFRLQMEFLTNVYLSSSSYARLINYRLGQEKDETPEREGKFMAFRRNGIDPNPAWENDSLTDLVKSLFASSQVNDSLYEGMNKADYLYLRYKESKNLVRGSGYLFYATDRAFVFHKSDMILFDELLLELLKSISDTLQANSISLALEIEALGKILIRKNALAEIIAS